MQKDYFPNRHRFSLKHYHKPIQYEMREQTSPKRNIILSSRRQTHCTFAGHTLSLKSEQEKHAAVSGGQLTAASHKSTLGNRLDTFSFFFYCTECKISPATTVNDLKTCNLYLFCGSHLNRVVSL